MRLRIAQQDLLESQIAQGEPHLATLLVSLRTGRQASGRLVEVLTASQVSLHAVALSLACHGGRGPARTHRFLFSFRSDSVFRFSGPCRFLRPHRGVSGLGSSQVGASASHGAHFARMSSRSRLSGIVLLALVLQLIAPAAPTAAASVPTVAPSSITAGSPTPTASPVPGAPITPSPSVSAPQSPNPSSANGRELILVKFKSGKTSAEIDAAIASLGGDSVRDLPQIRTRVIAVPASERAATYAGKYAKHASVAEAAPAIGVKAAGATNDPLYAQQWALPKIAWETAYANVPIVGTASIAVLDTGIDASHPDLAGRVILGTSFVGGDPTVDPNGHGTALAGIAAAKVDNTVGIAGVAYNDAPVLPVQVLHADGTGLDADVVAGVLWAADNGAHVILMGFSSPDFSAALQDAVNYAWSKGAVLVAATGNDGSAAPTYPAGMANVIGVAATDQNDAIGAKSNTGSATVAAPGVAIYATQPGGTYAAITGTSPAAAETAGLAALLVASGKSNSAASTQIRGATDPIAGQAFGRVNVNKALTTVATAPVPGATPTPTPPPTPPTYVVGAAPTVQNVSSGAADGRYGIGQIIPITVTFDGAVTVTGFPQLTLETGAIDAVVNFTSLSGNQKTLTFNYTVAAGQNSSDLDYVSTTALALNGGAITDAGGRHPDAGLTPSAPGAAPPPGSDKNNGSG